MTYEFFQEASKELIEAALYYEEHQLGLGLRFRNEVASAIQVILENPYIWRERAQGLYRRYNLPVFPYYIAYFVEDEIMRIVAIGHASRRPDYWRNRLQKQ